MISETLTSKGTAAITSDQWHVVHSHFAGDGKGARPFARAIVSEHDDRSGCRTAAKALMSTIKAEAKKIPVGKRDQVFARPPHFKSLKAAKRTKPKKG
jgi:hypothetical protein